MSTAAKKGKSASNAWAKSAVGQAVKPLHEADQEMVKTGLEMAAKQRAIAAMSDKDLATCARREALRLAESYERIADEWLTGKTETQIRMNKSGRSRW